MNGSPERKMSGGAPGAKVSTGIERKRLTQARLKELMQYNKETGHFIRLVNIANTKKGDIAGTMNTAGYIVIVIDYNFFLAHRLAWFYTYGYFPEYGLDHKDRIRHHNWIENLREKSQQCNMRNTDNFKINTSGVKGVCWYGGRKKWESKITLNNKTKHLGRYKEFHNAACARLAAEQCLDWSGCDASSPAFQYVQKMLGRQ